MTHQCYHLLNNAIIVHQSAVGIIIYLAQGTPCTQSATRPTIYSRPGHDAWDTAGDDGWDTAGDGA